MDFCNKLNGLADFGNTADRGSAVLKFGLLILNKVWIIDLLSHPSRERKALKTNILHTVGVKIGHKNFSNNADLDLNENFGQLKMAHIDLIYLPLFPPPPPLLCQPIISFS